MGSLGVVLSAAGFAELWFGTNRLAAALGLFTLLIYLLAYTPLKRRFAACTTVGAIPGAMPPLIGYAAAAGLIERLWGERMRAPARPLRDPKTVLQEWAQARGMAAPSYREVGRSGPDHSPEFRVAVELSAREPAEGSGRSKRAAEQAAAAAMLAREGVPADGTDG